MTTVATGTAAWAVDELFAAQRERRDIAPLSESWPELDEATAYAIQERLVERLVAAEGSHAGGLKLGFTSAAKQKQMSIAEPISGMLIASRMVPEGEALDTAALIHPKVEPEIAVVLKRSLEGPGVSVEQARAAIGSVCVAMEIIDSRFTDFRFGVCDVIADNTSAARHAISTFRVPPDDLDLRTLGVVFEKNGEVVATGAGAAILGDPARAVAWLANKRAARGAALAAGTVVMTGGLTDAVALALGDVVRTTIAHLGSLTLRAR